MNQTEMEKDNEQSTALAHDTIKLKSKNDSTKSNLTEYKKKYKSKQTKGDEKREKEIEGENRGINKSLNYELVRNMKFSLILFIYFFIFDFFPYRESPARNVVFHH